MRSLLWVAAAAVPAAGCSPSAKDVVDKNRPQLEARVRAIEQFAKKVESGEASAAPLKFPDGVTINFWAGTAPGNALRTHAEWVTGGEPAYVFLTGERLGLKEAREAVAGGPGWGDAKVAQAAVDRLLGPRYLVLVKVDEFTRPAKNLAGDMFTTGSIDFRVHAFDLEESRDLGVARRRAVNSDKVTSGDKYVSTERLEADLKDNASLEVHRAVP